MQKNMIIAEIIDKNTIEVYDLSQFNADSIMHSGQIFRYFKTDYGYDLISKNNLANLIIKNDKVIIKSNNSEYFYNFFDLSTDYNKIKSELIEFKELKEAINYGGGIRILKADFIETTISFIISANNNIKRFTKTLNLICQNYGDEIDKNIFAFPDLNQLQKIPLDKFKEFGCGYRSDYLINAIKQLKEIDINELKNLPNDLLIKGLKTIKGVGQKVASCIALFTGDLNRLDIAPVDTWIQKALNSLSDSNKTALLNHKYSGVAQQYIFYYLQYLHREL